MVWCSILEITARAQRNSFQAGCSTVQTLGTIWYDKQLVKWSASCYGHFTPYKRDPLSTWTVTYIGQKASTDVTNRKKYFGLPGIKAWPSSWQASTLLAKPFCNWLVPLQMVVWTPAIKFDQVLWQCCHFNQFGQTIYEWMSTCNGTFMPRAAVSVQLYSTVKLM